MNEPELVTLRSYNEELVFLGQKLEDKQNEIERELKRLQVIKKAISTVLESHPELNLKAN
jgi:hypothetical protein